MTSLLTRSVKFISVLKIHLLEPIKHGANISIIVAVWCFIDSSQWHLPDGRFARASHVLRAHPFTQRTRSLRLFAWHLPLYHCDNSIFLQFQILLLSRNSSYKLWIIEYTLGDIFCVQSCKTLARMDWNAIFTGRADRVKLKRWLRWHLVPTMSCIEHSLLNLSISSSAWATSWLFNLNQRMIGIDVCSARLICNG